MYVFSVCVQGGFEVQFGGRAQELLDFFFFPLLSVARSPN